jgi:endogenous inhibitor of DNA gyrase (YacG/DUF329 family)
MDGMIQATVTGKCTQCGKRFLAEERYFCSEWGRMHAESQGVLPFCSRDCHDRYHDNGRACCVCE